MSFKSLLIPALIAVGILVLYLLFKNGGKEKDSSGSGWNPLFNFKLAM